MKKYLLSSILSIFLLSGCGSSYKGNDNQQTSNNTTSNEEQNVSNNKKLIYGYLAGADVKIYQINNDGSLSLKITEKTNSDKFIGYFNPHTNDLSNYKFYLYEISNGYNCDMNFDGIKDDKCVENNATLHLIAKGSDLKKLDYNPSITFASQIIYEKLLKTLKYDFNSSTFNELLDKESKKILSQDIDNDSDINNLDIIKFKQENKNALEYTYKLKLKEILDLINRRKSITHNLSPIVGEVNLSGLTYGIDVDNNKKIAYTANYDQGLMTIDIKDPAHPYQIENLYTDGYALSITLTHDKTKVLIPMGYDGLEIIDVEDASNPFEIAKMDSNGSFQKIVLSNDDKLGYIAAYDKGLQIADLNDTLNPKLISSLDTDGKALGLYLRDKIIYLADYQKGLKIIDVNNSKTPTLISSVSTNGEAYDVIVKDNIAYVANGSKGLAIIDVNDKSNPKLLSTLDTKHYATSITLSKDLKKAYLKTDKGVDIIDITNKKEPKLISFVKTPSIARDGKLSQKGEFLYIADDNASLQIMDMKIE